MAKTIAVCNQKGGVGNGERQLENEHDIRG